MRWPSGRGYLAMAKAYKGAIYSPEYLFPMGGFDPAGTRGIAMTNDYKSKLSASLIVLVLTLSAMGAFPLVGKSQAASTANIYVPVLYGGSPVTDAWVNLTDVHTGSLIAAQYTAAVNSYVVSGAQSGYYRLDVAHGDYYDQFAASEFRFDGTISYTTPSVYLDKFPDAQWQWNVSVRNPGGNKIVGATVGFYDPVASEFVAKGVTNSVGGWVVVDMFNSPVVGDYDLVVVAKGFETYVLPVSVTGDDTRTITMTTSKKVSSFVTNATGSPASNVVSYLVNTDGSIPMVKRVLKSVGTAMVFDAYPGTFILVVDAYGSMADVRTVPVAAFDVPLTISLPAQTKRTEKVTIDYSTDFTAFSLNVNTTWSFDDAYPGLKYSDMGSLRMQIDLWLGNGDGTVDAGEAALFISKVNDYGTQYVSSSNLLTVNNTAYISSATTTGFMLNLVGSAVDSHDGVLYTYSCAYSAASGITPGAANYNNSLAYVRPDTPAVDYKYTIMLVTGYELVRNSTTANVVVTNYTDVKLDHVSGSATEIVALDFQESDDASAKGSAENPEGETDHVYVVKDDNGTVEKYIVRVGANVTFSGADSYDPNGNPLKYTWDFADGSLAVTTPNVTYMHIFTTAASMRYVTLTVTDAADRTDSTVLNVTCDGQMPRPVISVFNKTIVDNSITVEQRDTVVFNATDSLDDVVAVGDGDGIERLDRTIASVEFDYGDGNKSARIPWEQADQNVTHAYANAGNFTVVLNVTDVVGQWKNTTLKVFVNDTEDPKVSFIVKNATWGSSLVENKTLSFDATATTDNIDNATLMHFSWNFGDGAWTNMTGTEGGRNVTHAYAMIGQVQVVLNVTDLSGNWLKSSKFITISQGPRPNLRIDRIYFEPGNFTEDKSGTILVNMTNRGSAVATDVIVYFYKVNADGTLDLLGQSSEMYNTTTGAAVTSVEISGTVQVKFSVSFSSKGTYTLRVNATSDNQLKEATSVASGDGALVVEEAAWKAYALWGGVIAVIVLVPLLLFMRARWSKREKGPRREKKPREEEEE